MPENVSPSWIAPNEDGSVKRADAFVTGRTVLYDLLRWKTAGGERKQLYKYLPALLRLLFN
jgi:hypothetical protein